MKATIIANILINLLIMIQYWFFRDQSITTKGYFRRVWLFAIPIVNVIMIYIHVTGTLNGTIIPHCFKTKTKC